MYGDNFASLCLSEFISEMESIDRKEYFLPDLLVTCMSKNSRNNTYGRNLAGENKKIKGVVEGVHSAKIIEKYNLFHDMNLLRNITKQLCK